MWGNFSEIFSDIDFLIFPSSNSFTVIELMRVAVLPAYARAELGT
jgi:hypothetical protein